MDYEPVIGLEVHVQLATRSKLFCSCSAAYSGELANTHVCAVCLGLPGVLPVLNERALEIAVKTVLALNGEVARTSKFDRKNYFYPDLPKAYQISQYDQPIGARGHLDVQSGGASRRIRINRMHLEEDAGKLVHPDGAAHSLVDYNRCAVPLLEIVTEPDLRTSEEARLYLLELKSILEYLEASDCNMEEGSLRCDANVSVRPRGSTDLGTKTEIKNLNSFRAVARAIDYEIVRQSRQLEEGGRVVQETRLWDDGAERTASMRSKEEAHDYRYFPEPDLPPIVLEDSTIEAARARLPELPEARRLRFVKTFGLSPYDAGVLTAQRALAGYFEEVLAAGAPPKAVSNWISSELLGHLRKEGLDISRCRITPGQLAELVSLVESGRISGKIGKEVFAEMAASGRPPAEIIESRGLVQISDTSELEAIVEAVMADNPGVVQKIREGKKSALGFLVGQVMRATGGKANPGLVNEILANKLSGGGAR